MQFMDLNNKDYIEIEQAHEIMLKFDFKDFDINDILKETMTSLLKNASPKVHRYRFEKSPFVKMALAFYTNGGVNVVKEMLFYGDDVDEDEE